MIKIFVDKLPLEESKEGFSRERGVEGSWEYDQKIDPSSFETPIVELLPPPEDEAYEPFATTDFWETTKHEWKEGLKEIEGAYTGKESFLQRFFDPRPKVQAGFGAIRAAFSPAMGLVRATGIGPGARDVSEKLGASPETAAQIGEAIELAAIMYPKVPYTIARNVLRDISHSTSLYKVAGLSPKWEKAVDRLGQHILSKTPRWLRAGGGTPKEFREMKANLAAALNNEIEIAIELGSKLALGLSHAERLRADQILRGSIVTAKTPPKIVGPTIDARAHIDRLQEELVKLGHLSPETVERASRNFGPYFARLYEFRKTRKSPIIATGKLRLGTSRLKARGERITVNIPERNPGVSSPLGQDKGYTTVNIDGDIVPVSAVQNIEKTTDRADALKDVLAYGFRVESRAASPLGPGRKVTLFRDIPERLRAAPAGKQVYRTKDSTAEAVHFAKSEKLPDDVGAVLAEKTKISPEQIDDIVNRLREVTMEGGRVAPNDVTRVIRAVAPTEEVYIGTGLGELRSEPAYVFTKTSHEMSRQAKVSEFFTKVANTPEWVSATEQPGFIRLGDDVKTLGALAKKYVRADVADEINYMSKMPGDFLKILERLTNMWKVGKVTNPATMARNIISSTIIADWGGLSPFRPSGIAAYTRTLKGFLGYDPISVDWLKQAKEGGLYRATFNKQEINAMYTGMHTGWMKSPDSNAIIRGLDAVQALSYKIGKPVGHPTRIYGAIDHFFKSALYVHQRMHGKDHAIALRHAKKFGIDYQDISPIVREMRKAPLGMPFATFASKAIPLSIEAAVKHPIRFWKWPIAFAGMEEISKRSLEGDFPETTGKHIAATKRAGNLNLPRHVLLPTKDKDGRYQFLDLGYMLPFGDLVELVDAGLFGGTASEISFKVPGGPAAAVLELGFNRSLFTGRDIFKRTDTWPEAFGKMTDHLLKAWFPSLTPPIPGTGFTGGHGVTALRKATVPDVHIRGEQPLKSKDFFGRQKTVGTVIASKLLGINIKSVSLNDLRKLGLLKRDQDLRELIRKRRDIELSALPKPKKRRLIESIQKEIQKVLEDFSEKYRAGYDY